MSHNPKQQSANGTFIDIWLSPGHERFAYHWEQRAASASSRVRIVPRRMLGQLLFDQV
jgi:hypothetical protein